MHVLCPHCQNPIEIVHFNSRDEIPCPSCGSSFRLEDKATTGWNPRAGQKIGKFELIDSVGQGAFGTVYKARDPELDRIVAIKVPRASNIGGQQEIDRFVREARSVAQLRHPSIVTVHDVGQADGVPYLVSDFVEGITLADLLSARRPTPHESADLIAQVADALQYAHEHGVVHRDVKPSNIMLRDEGRGTRGEKDSGLGVSPQNSSFAASRSPHAPRLSPLILDFGLAKREAGEITMTIEGQVLGTPAYMSPEQARGEAHKVDGRGDVYSLGVILYQMLTGELPFRGTARMLLHQVLHDEPRAPRALNDRIARDLDTICLKALAKEPGRRYASASAFADDLRRFTRGDPILARPVGSAERLQRWCRRNPRIAALTGTLMLLLVAMAVGSSLVALHIAGINTDLTKARDTADTNAAAAEHNATEREQAQRREAQQRQRAEGQLVQLHVQNGLRLSDEGDLLGALPWFARALALDHNDPDHRIVHETRLAATLRDCPRLVQFWQHEAAVSNGVFSPDGSRVALAADMEVRVCNTMTGQAVTPALKHAERVRHVEFGSDGRQLLTVYAKVAQLWDVDTGKPAGEPFSLKDSILMEARFTTDGPRAVTATGGELRVWDLATRQPLGKPIIKNDGSRDAFLSPDGRRVVLTAGFRDPGFSIWNVATGTLQTPTLQHPGLWYFHAAFSSDGKMLVTARDDNTARLWDVATGRALTPPLRHGGWVLDAAFSPDGRRLLTGGSDDIARLWDTATGQAVGPPLPNKAAVLRVTFSPDGQRMATCSGNIIQRTVNMHLAYKLAGLSDVRIWDVATAKLVKHPLTHEDSVLGVVFSPEGRRVLTLGNDRTARLWDLATDRLLSPVVRTNHAVNAAQFSPDGASIVTAGGHDIHTGDPNTWKIPRVGEGRVWDLASGRALTPVLKQDLVQYTVAFSPDGSRVVTGSQDKTAQIWDARTGKAIGPRLKDETDMRRVAFTNDGQYVVTHNLNHWAKLWSAASGQPATLAALQWEGSGASSGAIVDFSLDARNLLTVSKEGVGVWDVATGKLAAPLLKTEVKVEWALFAAEGRRVLTTGPAETRIWETDTGEPAGPPLKEVKASDTPTLSADGRRLLGYNREGHARVWDVASGDPLSPPLRLGSPVMHAAFSPDGRFVLTASQDATARLWDARTGLPVSPPLHHRAEVNHAAFSTDGRRAVTASRDWTARVWNLAPDMRPQDDLFLLAHLLSGRQLDASGGVIAFPAAQVRDAWQGLRSRYPADFTTVSALADTWDRVEAGACEQAENWRGAVVHLDRLLTAAPRSDLFVRRGRALAELGQWSPAADDYGKASLLNPGDREVATRHALLCLGAGNLAGYRAGCAELLKQLDNTNDPLVANSLAWICIFSWDAVPDKDLPVKLAEKAVKSDRQYAYLNTLGSALCRAKRFEEACTILEEGIKLSGNGGTAWDGFLMAIAKHHLKQPNEARAWLDRAVKRMEESAAEFSWDNRLELQLLRREVETLVHGAPPMPGQQTPLRRGFHLLRNEGYASRQSGQDTAGRLVSESRANPRRNHSLPQMAPPLGVASNPGNSDDSGMTLAMPRVAHFQAADSETVR